MLHTKDSLQLKDTCRLRVKIQSNSNQKNAGATLIRQNRLQAKNGEKKQIRSLYNSKEGNSPKQKFQIFIHSILEDLNKKKNYHRQKER